MDLHPSDQAPAPQIPPPAAPLWGQETASRRKNGSATPNVWENQVVTHASRQGNDVMHARYFNLHLGRFLSTDPIGGSIGSSQSWNRYSYAWNNPLRLIDPLGLTPGDPEAGQGVSGTTAGCDQDSAAGDQPCNSQHNVEKRSGAKLSPSEVAFWVWFGRQRYGVVQASDGAMTASNQALVYMQMATSEALSGNEYMAYLLFGSRTAGEMYAIQSRGTPLDIFIFGMAGRLIESAATGAAFTADQQALVALAKEALRKRGVTEEEAGTLLEWAEEYGLTGLDHTGPRDALHWLRSRGGQPHIHVFRYHIPVIQNGE